MEKKRNPNESKILIVLVKNGDFMTTAQVASEAKMSWNTALFYLKEFYKRGWVEKEGERTIYWRALVEE